MDWFFKNKYLPVLVIVIFGLISGLTLFRDYGASWDEPDLYAYADQSVNAYSIKDRLDGQFNLDSLLGPDNLRLYGPAYLIFGRTLINFVKPVSTGILDIDLWHLINYFTFIAGTVVLYLLLLRWIKPMAAFIAVLLFLSQPVVFGIAWIDPKDVPFMVLFICTVFFGLQMVDHVTKLTIRTDEPVGIKHERFVISPAGTRKWLWFAGISLLISILVLVTSQYIESSLRQTIMGMDGRVAGDPIKQIFTSMARNSANIPLNSYAEKAVIFFRNSLAVLLVVSGLLALFAVSIRIYPKWIAALFENTRQVSFNLFSQKAGRTILIIFAASFFLGVSTTIRVLAPLAGFFIVFELARQLKWKSIPIIVLYGILALLIAFCSWPYLWQDTFQRFVEVFLHMSDNPVGVGVLFQGKVYDSKDLPIQYLPILLGITLTLPVILGGIGGMVIQVLQIIRNRKIGESGIMAAWFFIPMFYVLIFRPAMYDNYRHFLFILPPIFYFCAVCLEWIFSRINKAIQIVVILIALIPGIVGIVQLHPYEYSYYNEVVGGLKGAAGNYETDYWLTCYRELTLQINQEEKEADNLFVAFMPALVKYYSAPRFEVLKANDPAYPPESLILLPIRREASTLFPELSVAYQVVKDDVPLCIARRTE